MGTLFDLPIYQNVCLNYKLDLGNCDSHPQIVLMGHQKCWNFRYYTIHKSHHKIWLLLLNDPIKTPILLLKLKTTFVKNAHCCSTIR